MGCSGHCSHCQFVQLKPVCKCARGRSVSIYKFCSGWQFPWGREQEWWELGPAWQTQQVATQPILPYGWGRDTGNVKPAPNTFPLICSSRRPALRQHLQLCPHQEGQLHSGGTAPGRGHAEIRQGTHTCLGNFLTSQRPLIFCFLSTYPTLPPETDH